jgi:three-Cys-motif partner protein
MAKQTPIPHEFGGDWTTEKLHAVRKYLAAYTTIFTKNPRAKRLRTVYVDAFAGTGYRSTIRARVEQVPLAPELIDPDRTAFLQGSARIALEVEPSFNRYLFIEQNPAYVRELNKLKEEFPQKANQIEVVREEANDYLVRWCANTDWQLWRAVVFLDPYGMQVTWSLIETLAKTRAVDLWVLFPLGIAVNRLLTRREPPPEEWAHALTRIFGTAEWGHAFYPKRIQQTLFGAEEVQEKEADFDRIDKFFVKRLKGSFVGVADNPLVLRNSRNVPLYLLCFASANPRGAPTAIKIAQDILRG